MITEDFHPGGMACQVRKPGSRRAVCRGWPIDGKRAAGVWGRGDGVEVRRRQGPCQDRPRRGEGWALPPMPRAACDDARRAPGWRETSGPAAGVWGRGDGVEVARRQWPFQDRPRRGEGWLCPRCQEPPAMMPDEPLAGERLPDQCRSWPIHDKRGRGVHVPAGASGPGVTAARPSDTDAAHLKAPGWLRCLNTAVTQPPRPAGRNRGSDAGVAVRLLRPAGRPRARLLCADFAAEPLAGGLPGHA